jgi:hypothetical protein
LAPALDDHRMPAALSNGINGDVLVGEHTARINVAAAGGVTTEF